MATYNPRKAPNVSHYLANLNTIPSAHDVNQQDENFNIDDELSQFTNTEFLDFDTGNFLEQPAPEYGYEGKEQDREDSSAHDSNLDVKGMGFVNDAFPFADMSYLPPDQQPPLTQPLQTHFPTSTTLPSPLYTSPTTPPTFNPAPYPGQKHPLTNSPQTPTTATTPSQPEPETAASRLAAEEDKRRRNTAASARFRVKKKQREQALESTAKELENKAVALEQRIGQLEMENEWLRGLVVEKRGGEKEDLRKRWKGEGEGDKEKNKSGGERRECGRTEEADKA